MASYLPSQLQAPLALTTSAQDVGKPASGHLSIFRTIFVLANTTARTFNAGLNTSTADTAANRIWELQVLTQDLPFVFNGWLVASNSQWLTALASNAGSTVILTANGYDYTI